MVFKNYLLKLFPLNLLHRYVIVYFSILYLRYHSGIVTDEMLSMPKAPFLAVGLLEALGAATGMAAGGKHLIYSDAIHLMTIGLCFLWNIVPLNDKLYFVELGINT